MPQIHRLLIAWKELRYGVPEGSLDGFCSPAKDRRKAKEKLLVEGWVLVQLAVDAHGQWASCLFRHRVVRVQAHA